MVFIFALVWLRQEQKANREMKSIEANKIVKTLNWIAQVSEDDPSIIEPKLNEEGIYVCEIYLPLIEKIVIGLGDNKLESINNATQQTSNIIDEFLKENPKIKIRNMFSNQRFVLEEDDNGHLCIHMIKENHYPSN